MFAVHLNFPTSLEAVFGLLAGFFESRSQKIFQPPSGTPSPHIWDPLSTTPLSQTLLLPSEFAIGTSLTTSTLNLMEVTFFFFQPLARPPYPWFRIHVLLPPWMKGWGYEEDIVTCHTFHMPCGPISQAVAKLGYLESSSSALILHFCHSLRVCSSYMELSHMTHLTTIKAGARITSVFCSPLVPWDNFKQEQTSTPHEQQKSKTRALEVQESGLQGTWKAWHVTLSSYPQPFIIGVDLRTVFIF